MNDIIFLREYFHQLFDLDLDTGLEQWATAFDVFRSAWLLDDCELLLREVKGKQLNKASALIVLEQEGLYYLERHNMK